MLSFLFKVLLSFVFASASYGLLYSKVEFSRSTAFQAWNINWSFGLVAFALVFLGTFAWLVSGKAK